MKIWRNDGLWCLLSFGGAIWATYSEVFWDAYILWFCFGWYLQGFFARRRELKFKRRINAMYGRFGQRDQP